KAEGVAPVIGPVPAAERGAGVEVVVHPPAAAQPAHGAGGGPGRVLFRAVAVVAQLVPVGAPLEDVAVHVKQAVGVGLVRADLAGALQAGAARGAHVRDRAVDVGVLRGEHPAGVEGGIRFGAAAAGALPLGRGGQAVGAAGGLLGGEAGEFL